MYYEEVKKLICIWRLNLPEGHIIHRAAREHSRNLVGQEVLVSSPQGRFSDGARVLNGQRCLFVEAYGKHLIYGFAGKCLHVHLGLFGRIRNYRRPIKEPRGAVRVRLIGDNNVIDINGPTICETIGEEGISLLIKRLGPDLMRDDADPERAFSRIIKSRAKIGKLLIDQSVISGIGNIFRTEILWRQGIHPNINGYMIDRPRLKRLWIDAKKLLEIGVRYNTIITVNIESERQFSPKECVNIFGKSKCPECNDPVRRIDIDGRHAFVCETCQPLILSKKKFK